jgi:hypothetical protein
MDDLLLKVLSRLVNVYENLGRRVFEDAAHRALFGIGAAAKHEAERTAGKTGSSQAGKVVSFPLYQTRRHDVHQDAD